MAEHIAYRSDADCEPAVGAGPKECECRVCGGSHVNRIGEVEYYEGFAWPVYDCPTCGCRFTNHDETIYETMHGQRGTVYDIYRRQSAQAAEAFGKCDLAALRRLLCQTSKYRFIIEEVERTPKHSRLLEIGCSRGHLTSFFILAGYEITGVDISASAIQSATAAFGNHFVLEGDPLIEASAPYDVIYHVGTIGCVADPIGLTRRLLRLLRPGGRLFFNAPNLQSCWFPNQLWIDAAPPPDVVSIFPPGFWRQRFADVAEVEERVDDCEPDKSFAITLRKLFRPNWKSPKPVRLNQSGDGYLTGAINKQNRSHFGDAAWKIFEKSILKFGHTTGLSRLATRQPAEFGIFVRMIPRQANRVAAV